MALLFELTESQMKAMKPYFRKADKAWKKYTNSDSGECRGAIFCQINEDGVVKGAFFPYKYAKQLQDICKARTDEFKRRSKAARRRS